MTHLTLSSVNSNIRRLTTENLLIMRKIRFCEWNKTAGVECNCELAQLQAQYDKNEDIILSLCDTKQNLAYEIKGEQGSATVGFHVGDMLNM